MLQTLMPPSYFQNFIMTSGIMILSVDKMVPYIIEHLLGCFVGSLRIFVINAIDNGAMKWQGLFLDAHIGCVAFPGLVDRISHGTAYLG